MILSVDNLTFGYRKTEVFRGASLKIEKQGIYGLVAPNGSGKTTLLQLIMGLYAPNLGEITVLDSEKFNSKDVSFVQDNTVLYPYLSGHDHLQFICRKHKLGVNEINKMSTILGMDSYLKDKVSSYSLGMKQRLLLSMGLIKKPKLLLLDEPLNGLDPTSTILMRETLQDVAKNGTTILVSSHNLSEMDRITDNVFFIKNKKIIEEHLSKLKEEKLKIEVLEDTINQVIKVLNQEVIPFEREENAFYFPVKDITPNEVVRLFVQYDMAIQHIETSYIGAETRYRALFEEEFSYVE